MADEWIKWVKGLAKKPKVLAMAKALNLSRREVASACMELWEWADENTIGGKIKGVCGAFVDELLGIEKFAENLLKVRWIRLENGSIIFCKFTKHNGKSAKRRALHQRNTAHIRAQTKRTRSASDEDEEEEENKRHLGARRQALRGNAKRRSPDVNCRNQEVNAFIDVIAQIFQLPPEILERQRRSFAAVGWRIVHLANFVQVAAEISLLADKAKKSGKDRPIATWQTSVNQYLESIGVPKNGKGT